MASHLQSVFRFVGKKRIDMTELYLDGSDHVAGRLATQLAKFVLKGNKVFVVNAEKVVVSGTPRVTTDHYKTLVARGDPYHGPFYPKRPDRILKRIVRGMVPKSPRGRDALKRLTIFVSVPDELKSKKFERVKSAENNLECKQTTLGDICHHLTGKDY